MKRAARVPGTQQRTLRALVVLPDPDQPGLSSAERLALRVRAEATTTGRCVCGATWAPVQISAGLHVVPMEHEVDCPATARAVDRLKARLGDELKFRAVVVELRVAA